MTNAGAAHIAIKYGVTGPVLTFATACASSALAVGEAFLAIRQGRVRTAIVVGSEALLTNGLLAAWDSLRVLASADPAAPERSCKPFSRNRSGFVLGEGAAALLLESSSGPPRPEQRVYGEICGYGISCDASHLTTPSSAGQARAMTAALVDAGLTPAQLDYVNAHGTATAVGDRVETEAIKVAFGGDAHRIPVSSTKALHGHLLGAAGVLELAICIGVIQEQVIPPTMHLDEPDATCDLDYVPNVARSSNVRVAMSNSFAFGGTNVCLVVRRGET
jgi:3-oxoacyl-[acyl-carrier-protein] synthase II